MEACQGNLQRFVFFLPSTQTKKKRAGLAGVQSQYSASTRDFSSMKKPDLGKRRDIDLEAAQLIVRGFDS